jgi:hypothetical protein
MRFLPNRRLPAFKMGRPQQLAALLLLVFLGECLWVIAHQQLSSEDYRYARCGREMWERPSPLAGYFTTCGNLNGDGTFAYRLTALPLTAQRLLLLAQDHFRKPEDRLYPGGTLNGSTWESRHQLSYVIYLMHVPFVLFAMWLGGGLWWVARRLFGNEGGFLALALYCFCPEIVRSAVVPNNELLAMWGLYGLVYTAIGVAHAMQGPRRKWKPRIALLTLALGLTTVAHLLAAILGFLASVILMFYLAERRRSVVLVIVTYAAIGAMILDFASFGFRLEPFTYVFTGGAARFWFSLDGIKTFATDQSAWPILIAFAIAVFVFAGFRRSRYFGNITPLAMVLAAAFLMTTQVFSAAWLWALPFLFTFIGGVFADVLETRQRRLFLATTCLLVASQAIACLASLPSIARG